jgi:hypothetical protein
LKGNTTAIASVCNLIASPIHNCHRYIIPQIEEKYCEIAVKRLAQSVMRLEV